MRYGALLFPSMLAFSLLHVLEPCELRALRDMQEDIPSMLFPHSTPFVAPLFGLYQLRRSER
ncbi:MAG: hypothetical protein AAGF04_01530 [Chlamydiota bacterium]